ncbi:ABC transporter substrate-binding protein [Atopobium fossor]|uniref:ABC transporter substrate-binding protein n=1 Tax=Atopobium fossor TaxID=39487 RepID=UPI0003FAB8A3|nr:ABC transporter substrate-binding protein [Atopobium fossor]
METPQAQMSRRLFVQAMAAVGATSAFALAGCGSKRAGSASDAEGDYTITLAQGADPRGLDPALVDDGESAEVLVQVYENILQYEDKDCSLRPGLAKSYEVSDDGLTYTFALQTGVKFHDGTDFNAAAVKANLDRQLEPNRTADMPYASFTFGSKEQNNGIDSVETPDDSTVIIKMRAVSTAFLANLAMALAAPIASPKAIEAGTLNEKPIGTGPFKFVSWTKNSDIKLERFDDYWDKENAAKPKNVVIRIIAESATRVTALANGEVDIITGIDEAVVDQIESNGDMVSKADGMNINYMAFNCDSELFKSKEARIAVAQAIDVPTIVDSLYKGYGTYANSIMPTWMAPYDKDVVQTTYDAAAAKEELARLGITKISCITYSNPRPYNGKGGTALAEAVQGYLRDAGVEMTIDQYDWTSYKDAEVGGNFDICFYGWVGDNGDPDNFMNLLSDTDPSLNAARFNNSEYKKLIAQGLQTPNGSARDDIYLQCEKIAASEQPWLPISHATALLGYKKGVDGFVFHPTGNTYLRNCTKSA